MASQSRNLLHRWIFPDDDLVEGVAVSRHDLVARLGKHQVADLRACIDVVYWLQSVRVPKSNAPIGGAATSCQ